MKVISPTGMMILALGFATAAVSPATAATWSPEQGKMDWNSAMARCQSMGMRLPSIDNLAAGMKNRGDRVFRGSQFYWSRDQVNSTTARIGSSGTNPYYFNGMASNFKTNKYNVICVGD